jgi:hypothetical protein
VLKPSGCLLIANEVYHAREVAKRNSEWVRLLNMNIHTPDEYQMFLTEAGYTQIEFNDFAEKNWIAAVARKG